MISHGQWNVRGSDLLFAGKIIKELVYDSLVSWGPWGWWEHDKVVEPLLA